MPITTKPHKLAWNTPLGTANNVASLKITRPGVITSISFALMGIAQSASTTASHLIEVSKQTISSIQVNDTPPTVLAESCIGYTVANAAQSVNQVIPGLRIPVAVSDTINVHQLGLGPNPASFSHSVMVYVDTQT